MNALINLVPEKRATIHPEFPRLWNRETEAVGESKIGVLYEVSGKLARGLRESEGAVPDAFILAFDNQDVAMGGVEDAPQAGGEAAAGG